MKANPLKIWGFALLMMIVGVSKSYGAQGLFSNIRIHGNQRIETDSILAHLKLQPGVFYSEQEINQALRRLFSTSFFSDVSLKISGKELLVNVVENPLVNQVGFEGNKEIEDKTLGKELQLRPRQVYTLARLKHDTKRIQDLYRLKGYFAATVTPNLIRRDQNRVDVVFEIKEGNATSVSRINFVGNYAFDEAKLEEILMTKESRWYRWFTPHDNYDPARLSHDQELLRQFYLQNGYVDFRVKSAVAELSPDHKNFFITFTIEEGQRYKYGSIEILSDYPKINVKDLEPSLLMKKEQWYNAKDVEDTITALTDALGNQGFAFVDVVPSLDKKDEKNVVDLKFEIKEGPHVFIDRIFIKGNQRTNSDVIRRELRIQEGDAYNTSKIRDSERRLKNLGYFKDVKISKEAGDYPDRVHLSVEVDEEASTGSLQFSGGFSTSDGPLVGVKLEERNLGGRGQYISISTQVARRSQDYTFSFTEPYFVNRPLSAGFDLFKNSRSPQGLAYDEKTLGGRLRLGYELRKDLYQRLSYTLRNDELSSIESTASELLKKEKRKTVKSILSQTLIYDKTDNHTNPSMGYDIELTNTFTGLGGDGRNLNNILAARYFQPVFDNWTLAVSSSVGGIVKFGEHVRIADRFNLGGYSLRGFDFNGVGPRDKKTRDSLGGLYFWKASAEVLFPFGLPKEFGMKASVFMDMGCLFGHDFSSSLVNDSKKIRISTGVGLNFVTPIMGTVGVDFAFPILKSAEDKNRVFLLRFGPRF